MPITPFHFGPGAALHALAPRHIGFLPFCAANVLIGIGRLHQLRLAAAVFAIAVLAWRRLRSPE